MDVMDSITCWITNVAHYLLRTYTLATLTITTRTNALNASGGVIMLHTHFYPDINSANKMNKKV